MLAAFLSPIVFSFLIPTTEAGATPYYRHKKTTKEEVKKPYIKTSLDIKVDELISKHLDPKKYSRASIYDIYPKMEEKGSDKKKELAKYLNYARKDLEKISKGEYLKPIRLNFDLDGNHDYAAILRSTKKKENYLMIANDKELLLLSPFFGTHLELHNYGKYPTIVPTKEAKKTINSPAIKLVSFEKDSYILHYDRYIKNWDTTLIPF